MPFDGLKPHSIVADERLSEEFDIQAAVARNLKELRTERKLSLDTLATRSGVSRAMLNQIENNKSTPTISLLWKIACGLNVPINRLIQQEKRETAHVLRYELSKVLHNTDNTFSSRALFVFDSGPRQMEFYEIVIQPGGVEVAEAHARGTTEHLIVVQGQARITVDAAVHDLQAHDALVFVADVPHAYANPGKEEALIYLVVTFSEPVTY